MSTGADEQRIIRGYELREKVGAGGFGAVYRAFQPLVGREVAIKVILPEYVNNPDFIRRFEFEAHVVARLEHIHIVPLYDYWREASGAYLVMRWLPNNLRKALSTGLPPLGTLSMWIDQIASGLDLAHRNGVIHRDLKPDNILLDDLENAYLADFGIAADQRTALPDDEAVYGTPAYLSPEQIQQAQQTPQTDIYCLGILIYEMMTGAVPFKGDTAIKIISQQLYEPIPPLQTVRTDLPTEVNRVLQRATAKKPEDRYPDVTSMAKDLRHALKMRETREMPTIVTPSVPPTSMTPGSPTRPFAADPTSLITGQVIKAAKVNPYKGLRSFQEGDANDFFGRAALIRRLLTRIDEPHEHLLAVVGPSGSGKSSVVYAGLLPALRKGVNPGSENWFVASMIPGITAFESLETALLSVAVNPPANIMTTLQESPDALHRLIQQVLPDQNQLLLVIDQFEEVFTLAPSEDVTEQFLLVLHTALTAPDSRLRCILTMRADFYDRPLLYPEFGELIRRSTEVVLPLNSEEIREAITGPAARNHVIVEPELVLAVLHDVNEQPGSLPLLEYALTEVFEQSAAQVLTLETYRRTGGVRGALAKRAEEVYTGLNPEQQRLARQIFLRLVTLGEGQTDTRRRVLRSELVSLADNAKELDAVLNTFSKYRLLTLDSDPITRDTTVEVAHEALINTWSLFQQWIASSRDALRLQRLLAAAAREWIENNRHRDYLTMGARLAQFQQLTEDKERIALSAVEREYVETSLRQQAEREAEAERQRTAHLTLGQRAAHLAREAEIAEAQAANRLRYLAGALVIILLLVIASLIITWQAARRSDSLRLAAEAINVLDGTGDSELATLLALHSVKQNYTLQGDAALQLAASQNYIRRVLDAGGAVTSVHFRTDGQLVVVAGGGILKTYRVADGTLVREYPVKGAAITVVRFSRDGQWLASGDDKGTITLWSTADGSIQKTITAHRGTVHALTFAANDATLLSGGDDGLAILWDATSGNELHRYEGHTGSVESAVFSANGTQVLTASMDGSARLFDSETAVLIRQFTTNGADRLHAAALSPDGKWVIGGGYSEVINLWDAETGTLVRRFSGHADAIYSLVFTSDSRRIMSASADRLALIWNLDTGAIERRYVGHAGTVSTAVFSADGRYVITGSDDGTARLWNVQEESAPDSFPHSINAHDDTVYHVAYSPRGDVIASAGKDGTARIWQMSTGRELVRLQGHTQRLWGIAFSADGKRVITSSDDQTARIWDVATGQELLRLDHTATVWAARISPDGKRAITGGGDMLGHLWDLTTGKQVLQLKGHTGEIYGVGFSPDSKTVVTVSVDKTARLWDAATGTLLRVLEGHTDQIYDVAFSHDGKYVATCSRDTTARIWEVDTGKEVRSISGHNDVVWTVEFSPDDKRLLTAGQDKTVRLWDLSTGQELRRIAGHRAAVTAAHFSPDGKLVVSSSYDHTVRISALDYQSTVTSICARVQRDLSLDERSQYGIQDTGPTCGP